MAATPLNPASAAAQTGSGNDVCFEDKQFPSAAAQKTQIKFQGSTETDFDVEIADVLTASGWRVAAGLLMHAALLIEAGDYLDAERNRRQAREQFIEANDLFRQFQEMRAAEAVSLYAAQAFR